MDTKQKNRETVLPESAQQRNGAVRSPEEQRRSTGKPVRKAAPEQRTSEKPRQASAAQKKVSQRDGAPKQKRPGITEKPRKVPAETKAAAGTKKAAPEADLPDLP